VLFISYGSGFLLYKDCIRVIDMLVNIVLVVDVEKQV